MSRGKRTRVATRHLSRRLRAIDHRLPCNGENFEERYRRAPRSRADAARAGSCAEHTAGPRAARRPPQADPPAATAVAPPGRRADRAGRASTPSWRPCRRARPIAPTPNSSGAPGGSTRPGRDDAARHDHRRAAPDRRCRVEGRARRRDRSRGHSASTLNKRRDCLRGDLPGRLRQGGINPTAELGRANRNPPVRRPGDPAHGRRVHLRRDAGHGRPVEGKKRTEPRYASPRSASG